MQQKFRLAVSIVPSLPALLVLQFTTTTATMPVPPRKTLASAEQPHIDARNVPRTENGSSKARKRHSGTLSSVQTSALTMHDGQSLG